MKTNDLQKLVPGQVYRVQIRNFDLGRQQHRPSRRVRRVFLHLERRLDGTIPCAVFTSAIRRGRSSTQVLSVPHYDLVAACPVPG